MNGFTFAECAEHLIEFESLLASHSLHFSSSARPGLGASSLVNPPVALESPCGGRKAASRQAAAAIEAVPEDLTSGDF
jgi:hypothetical protein